MFNVKIMNTRFYRYGIALACSSIALLLSALLWDEIYTAPFLFFYAAVIISAWLGGVAPGMLAAAFAIVSVDSFLMAQDERIFGSAGNIIIFVFFALIATFISLLEEKRRLSQASLRELRDELEIILNSVNDGITAQDRTGRAIFANTAAAELTGYMSAAQMMQSTGGDYAERFELYDEHSMPLGFSAMPRHQVFQTGQRSKLTFKMRRRDEGSRERWIELTSSPVFDDTGKVKLAVNVMRDITDQINAMRDRTRLATIVENSYDAIMGKDLQGVITSWNPGAERLYGYTAEETIGRQVAFLFPEDIKLREERLRDRIHEGEDIRHYETRRVRKDGRVIDIWLTISPLRDNSGQIIGFSTVERDISERRRLDQLREDNQRFLRNVLNSLPIFVGVLTPDGILTEANRAALDMGGLASRDVLEKPFDQAYWWTHEPQVQETIRNAMRRARDGEDVRFDEQLRIGEDEYLAVDFSISPMFDTDGKLTHLIPAAVDITARTQREQEILRLTLMAENDRQRLNSIVSSVPGVVFETRRDPGNSESQALFVSNYTETLLGYSPQEWHDDPDFWYTVIHPDDIERVRRRTAEMYETGQADTLQFRCLTREGQVVHVESRFTMLHKEGRSRGAAGVMMDITQRKVMEEALVQYARDLRASNKELEQFAYIASHDLQEPLRMVTSYLQLVDQRYGDKLDTDAKEFIAFAVDGASRMKRLISDLLTYSRVQRAPLEPETVDMAVVLKNVLNSVQVSVEETGAVITYDDLPQITAHESQIEQVLRNLVSNALKFHGEEPPEIHIGARTYPTHWEFCVRDSGIGIDEKYMDRIFVIFQRLHSNEQYPGTGIGLAICKKIVEKHGGEIRVESRPGEGTTFYFTIPTAVGKGSRNDN